MKKLIINTATDELFIVLKKDNEVFSKSLSSAMHHNETMLPSIDELLQQNNVDINDIDEFGVVVGPGSFTGERIAVTIAKTFAYCLNVPIRVIDALSILSIGVDYDKKIVSIEDRNGAYVGIFDKNNNLINDIMKKYLNLLWILNH